METAEKTMVKPWSFKKILLLHTPMPRKSKSYGTHPSSRLGAGEEPERIRKLQPGESPKFLSPVFTARFDEPWVVLRQRKEEIRIIVLVDLCSDMDFLLSPEYPTKRLVAAKIASTLGVLTVKNHNEGVVEFIGIGERIFNSGSIRGGAQIRNDVKRSIIKRRLRAERGNKLSSTLKSVVSLESESLVFVISDFNIDPNSDEWNALSIVYKKAKQSGIEMVFIRVVDPLELNMPSGGSVTIDSGSGGSSFTSFFTNRRLLRHNKNIRDKLLKIVGEQEIPEESHTRFLEIVWRDDGSVVEASFKFFFTPPRRIVLNFRVLKHYIMSPPLNKNPLNSPRRI